RRAADGARAARLQRTAGQSAQRAGPPGFGRLLSARGRRDRAEDRQTANRADHLSHSTEDARSEERRARTARADGPDGRAADERAGAALRTPQKFAEQPADSADADAHRLARQADYRATRQDYRRQQFGRDRADRV